MKKIIKKGIFIAGLLTILILSATSSAETLTDETGDVWVYKFGTTGMVYNQYSGSRDNVDITSVSYDISGSTVTASLTVAGQIVNDAYHTYFIYLENPSGQYYASYSAGGGLWMGTDKYGGEVGELTNPVSGNTFTATFEISYPEDSFDVYGFASESVDATEAYHDYGPNMFAPYYQGSTDDETGDDSGDTTDDNTGGEDTTGDTSGETDDSGDTGESNDGGKDTSTPPPSGTPGFEFLALITAFAAIVLILRKRF